MYNNVNDVIINYWMESLIAFTGATLSNTKLMVDPFEVVFGMGIPNESN
jgi:hypothetical protein